MTTPLTILKHPDANKAIQTLPGQLVDSLEKFEEAPKNNGDLLPFAKTKPFSPYDALGNRTRVEHYHLLPCKPDCYLVWLVRTIGTAYILDISLHPEPKAFTSSEIEEQLYSRFAELCPELSAYELPSSYRYVFPVRNKDKFGARTAKSTPYVVPVRTPKSDYLPLGQLGNLTEERNRVGVVIGTFEIPTDQIPDAAMQCIDSDEHPDRESLTLFAGGWVLRAGVYRPETEQLLLWFCELHHVVMITSSRRKSAVLALNHEDYVQLVNDLKARFPQIEGNEQEIADLVDDLTEHFPLHRP